MVSRESRGRSSVAQGLTGLEHEGESCTNRQVEEFRASDKQGTVAKYLSEEGSCEQADEAGVNFKSG